MDTLKNLQWKSKTFKLGVAFVFPLVVTFVLSPGVFVEITPKGVEKGKKIAYSSAAIHSFIVSALFFALYYFYLSKSYQ
jgi:uncharacterized BrkB/YihY/UPF0761 family membrane protein